VSVPSIEHLSAWLRNLPGGAGPLGTALYKIAAVAIVCGALWLVLKLLTRIVGRRLARAPLLRDNTAVMHALRRSLFLGVGGFAGTYLLRLFDQPLLEKLLLAGLIVLLAGPAKTVLITVLTYLEHQIADRTPSKVDDILFDLLNRLSGAVLYVTAVILALDVIGINVMPFIAGAGVAGIAVGFAAKDTLSNLIAGVLLIIDRPFEVGDRIEVWSAPAGSSSWGDVIDIGLRATRIRTTDNIVVIIPNNEIMKRDIVNYTILDGQIRVRVNIGIGYAADIEKAKQIITEVARRIEWAAPAPPPKVVVRSFGESSVELQLRVWIMDARRRMDTISFVVDNVKMAFDAAGIEIPYPKRDIFIHTRPAPTEAGPPASPG
jgi:MscS family membrane protein